MNYKIIFLTLIFIIGINQTSAFDLSGNVSYQDINGSIYLLEGANVSATSLINTTTFANGSYVLTGLNGIYTINISKGLAYSTSSFTISVISNTTTSNVTLNFSHPSMTTPDISGNLLISTYSHNFKTINLWENPDHVWGIYHYNNSTIKEVCIYQGSNIFACNLRSGVYTFQMNYSDIYNTALTLNRSFTTDNISIVDGLNVVINPLKSISSLSQVERERSSHLSFLQILFVMVVIILGIIAISFTDKRETKIIKER